jgi:LysR family hca operon transcriptional activator
LKSLVLDYASKVGITLKAEYEAENLSSAMSLVASTGGLTLIPLYAQNMLTPNVVARALDGVPPMIDLMLGFNEANASPLVRSFLSRADELIGNVKNQSIIRYAEAQ